MSALRAVVVGAGGMGRAWASTIVSHPDVSLVGWVDLFTDRVAEGIEAAGLKDVSIEEDIEAALSKFSPDFVVDVAVPEAHFEITRAMPGTQRAGAGRKADGRHPRGGARSGAVVRAHFDIVRCEPEPPL